MRRALPLSRERLLHNLQYTVPRAQIVETALPLCPEIKLLLITPDNVERHFSESELRIVLNDPPYWTFAWASGQAFAYYILHHQQLVRGKTILDFGAGSGVVAVASAMAGARKVIACDIDPHALDAIAANAALNNVEVFLCESLDEVSDRLDIITAADVFYDRDNLHLLEVFLNHAPEIWVADSRLKSIEVTPYEKMAEIPCSTFPDINELAQHNRVVLYRACASSFL